MIVGITGRAGAGKDTVADLLVRDHKAVKVALADEMKRIVASVYGFTELQLWGPSEERNKPDLRYPRGHTYRKIEAPCLCCGRPWTFYESKEAEVCYLTPRFALQLLGTEWARTCFKDTWVRKTMEVAKELLVAVTHSSEKGVSEELIDGALPWMPEINRVTAAEALGEMLRDMLPRWKEKRQ